MMIEDMSFSLPLFNPSYWCFLGKGTHTPHLSHLLFDRNKFPEDWGTAVLLHKTVFQCSQNYIWIIWSTNQFSTIHTKDKTANLASHTGALPWYITPGSITVNVYFALGRCCSHRTPAGETQIQGQEGWLLSSDASTLRRANKQELGGLLSQAQLRIQSPRATAVLLSVS